MNNRLKSLDVMRGITIAGMILVNNPGSWGYIYAPLRHAEWHGLTPTDLVFPFFMFIMGVSTYFSLRKYNFEWSWPAARKLIGRTAGILLIGWAIAWLSLFLRRAVNPEYAWIDAVWNFSSIRTLGVLPRLAICYFFTAVLALSLPRKALKWIVALILVAYAVILMLGNGYEFSNANVIAVVDRHVLGVDHMYSDTIDGVRLKFDPEGLLSTLPSIAHCMIGFLCGAMIVRVKDNEKRALNLLVLGTVLTMAGFLLSYGFPINKKIWSPTFVLTTCGLASLLLGFLLWVIDIKGRKRWSRFFEVFGVNPLFLYVLSDIFALAFAYIQVPDFVGGAGNISLHGLIYEFFVVLLWGDSTAGSLGFALFFIMINWCCGLPLYKKKIYIKI